MKKMCAITTKVMCLLLSNLNTIIIKIDHYFFINWLVVNNYSRQHFCCLNSDNLNCIQTFVKSYLFEKFVSAMRCWRIHEDNWTKVGLLSNFQRTLFPNQPSWTGTNNNNKNNNYWQTVMVGQLKVIGRPQSVTSRFRICLIKFGIDRNIGFGIEKFGIKKSIGFNIVIFGVGKNSD